jgi:hypothetical protein
LLKRFLFISDDGLEEVPPTYVMSATAKQAMRYYCRYVQSKDPVIRQYVEDLSSLDSFSARLLFSYEDMRDVGEDGVLHRPPMAIVRKKVLEYFSLSPHLGELFLRYLEDDRTVLTEAVYQYVSERYTDGIHMIEDSEIRTFNAHE